MANSSLAQITKFVYFADFENVAPRPEVLMLVANGSAPEGAPNTSDFAVIDVSSEQFFCSPKILMSFRFAPPRLC